MTRINLVDPSQLTDKHLMAEYRELPRIFTAVKKLEGLPPEFVSKTYILGTGHCKFFYDKIGWLYHRYDSLYAELVKRKYNLDYDMFSNILNGAAALMKNPLYCVDYQPTPEEIYLNMARIVKRSNLPNVIIEAKSE